MFRMSPQHPSKPLTATKTKSTLQFERAFSLVWSKLRELGLSVSTWDNHGELVGCFKTCSEFCQTVYGCGGGCQDQASKLAHQIAAQTLQRLMNSAIGCCMLGVPIWQRRRLQGIVVACYPPIDLIEGDRFQWLCDRLGFDRLAMTNMGKAVCRYTARQAGDGLKILNWLLEREQDVLTAKEELATLSRNLASTYEELTLLYTTSSSMKVTHRPGQFVKKLCQELLEVMNVEAVASVINRPCQDQSKITLEGNINISPEDLGQIVRELISTQLAEGGTTVLKNDFHLNNGAGTNVRSLLAVPVVAEEQPVGSLVALNKRQGDFGSVDEKLLSSVGNLLSVFVENNFLYADIRDLLMGVLHALTAAIDAKDTYTCGHSQRVALIAKRLGEVCDLGPQKVERLYLTGLLHDIGKIGVSEATLSKKGPLTTEEYESVKRHPEIGAYILRNIRQFEDVVVGIISHHERPDGKGYPRGLKDDDIPLEGQILGLADCFDAMTSDRTYRKAMPVEKVIEEIRNQSGVQFSSKIAEKLLSLDLGKLWEELAECTQNAMLMHSRRLTDETDG